MNPLAQGKASGARRARATQADLARILNGARKAGFDVRRVEVDANGTIVLFNSAGASLSRTNSWDEVLQ